MELGEKIKLLRKQQDLTLEQLGDKVGVGKSTVRKWEQGIIANMRRDKIDKLAKALGCSPAYLMGWDDVRNPEKAKADALRDAEILKDDQYVHMYADWKLLNEPGKNIVIDLVELLAKQKE